MAKLEIGCVFSIETQNGKAYFQYVLKNEILGELIRVLPGRFHNDIEDLQGLVNEHEIFMVHFPLKAAARRKLVCFVGHFKLPNNFKCPKFMRSKQTNRVGELIKWQIIDYETWEREDVLELSDEQKKLSPWGTWNDTLLIDRLNKGWTPEKWI